MPVRPIGPEEQPNQRLIVDPASAQLSVITGLAPNLGITWRLINNTDGSVVITESSDAIVAIDDAEDPALRRYQRPYTAPASADEYLAIWRYQTQEQAQAIVVSSSLSAAFASTGDVGTRLGRALSSSETDTVTFLLDMAAAVIADAAGYDDGWAIQLTRPPQILRNLSVELVLRGMANPTHAAQIRQQVGSYSYQASWSTIGMTLSDAETMTIRRAVHGRTTEDVHIASSFEREQDEYWLRKESGQISDPVRVIQ